MSDLPDKESSNTTQPPSLCEKCGKPFAISPKFSVTSLFQTDPGEGLSRWQEFCKCDSSKWADEPSDLPQPANESSTAKPSDAKEPDSSSGNSDAWSRKALRGEDASSGHLPETHNSREEPSQSEPESSMKLEEQTGLSRANYAQPATFLPSSTSRPSSISSASSESSESSAPSASQAAPPSWSSSPSVPAEQAPPPNKYSPPKQDQTQAPQVYMIGDRYEVESVIGKGTFGPIYKARDIATGKVLCLKMVSTPISRHRRIVKRIMQEVEKAKTLNHPHIVPIYDSSIDKSGRPFYVMDLIEPGSLKHVIKQEGFLDVPEVIDIFLDVCEALSYAHEHGILHRDLKPGNILLSGNGTARRAKVCDFGIIKALPSVGSEAQEMTQSTDVFADPSCMSPEQCLGRRLDIRSDIYSLGCSMYEAIIGKKVFTGPNALSVVVQHFKSTPRSFDAVMYNCDISPDVEAVVLKMLEKAPEHRYQEISQVMEDLRLLKSHRKPSFAYQKKKSGGLNLMLPFSVKEQPDSAERMFDIVLNKKKLQEKNQHQNWNDEAKQQIVNDIGRLAKKGVERNLPQVRLLRNNDGPDKIIARAEPTSDEAGPGGSAGPPPGSRPGPVGPIEFDQRNAARQDVIRPNQLKLPVPPEAFHQSPASSHLPSNETNIQAEQGAQVARAIAPVYRASDLYPAEIPELFDGDVEETIAPIVTVEQARREIPDHLLQISRTPGFITLPMTVALVTTVSIIVIIMQMVASAH
jgi:serine/threonine protein kinase